jgi:hypothetical protein
MQTFLQYNFCSVLDGFQRGQLNATIRSWHALACLFSTMLYLKGMAHPKFSCILREAGTSIAVALTCNYFCCTSTPFVFAGA